MTPSEAEAGANSKGSLMYGELAPAGARCVGDALLLASKDGGKVVDVGMGAGKVALQWFLEHQNLSTVVGVEKVESRFRWDVRKPKFGDIHPVQVLIDLNPKP